MTSIDTKDCISIKEYAAKKGITISAVTQSIHGKRNSRLLEGHIFKDGSGKYWLDSEAVRILDANRQNNPVVIDSAETQRQHLEEVAELKERIKELSQTNQNISETLKNVAAAKTLLEDKAAKVESLTLQATNLQNEKDKLEKQVTELKEKLSALKNRSLWQRIRNIDI